MGSTAILPTPLGETEERMREERRERRGEGKGEGGKEGKEEEGGEGGEGRGRRGRRDDVVSWLGWVLQGSSLQCAFSLVSMAFELLSWIEGWRTSLPCRSLWQSKSDSKIANLIPSRKHPALPMECVGCKQGS